MGILRRLTVAGTALALTLLGLVLPTPALAGQRSAFPGAIDLPSWIMEGRKPIESGATSQDNWVVTGKVVTYLSGERAGATDDRGEELVAGIDVFARYQANNGAWSPVFKTTTTATTSLSKTNRASNYAIKMRDFVDYNGELGQFRPGEGHAQRLQVWIDPKQVPHYRLTFSERTGGVIQGYSTPKDYNYTASQMMQWGFLYAGATSTQVSQMNIGLIKVANSQADLGLDGVTIEPSLPQAGTGKRVLKGYVRWENQTPNRIRPADYVGKANLEDNPANAPAAGYVVVAAMKSGNNIEARCTTTTNPSNDNGKTPNWQINFQNLINVRSMKFQVFKGTCEQGNVNLLPLPELMAYWSPFPTTVDSWGTNLTSSGTNQGWTSGLWEDNVRVLLRPLQMQLLPHGTKSGSSAGTQSFYGDTVTVDYSRLPLNTPLVAHLYTGKLSDSGSGTAVQSVKFSVTSESGSIIFPEPLTGNTFKEYWVDVLPEKISMTGRRELQVLASQSFLYKPIQLEINKGAANTPGTFTITKKAPADNLVKLTGCEVVSDKLIDTTATADDLPYKLKRDTSPTNSCTLRGTPEKSGTHSLWVKFTFTDEDNKPHTSVQYLPWTVEPRLKPQIEPGTSDSELSKYSPLEKFPAVGVPYSGLVSPFPDWQGRHFTYQVFDAEPVANSAAREPGTDGKVSLRNGNIESGLKFDTATGQVTGTTQAGKSAVFWVKATDEDGGVTLAVKYEIHPGTPLILQRAQLPTGTGGSEYQNANGTPIVIWVSGGHPTANQLSVNGTNLSRNTYDKAEILGVFDGDNPNNSVNSTNIGGVNCSIQTSTATSTATGGGQFILCSGTPRVSKATTYYLQVKYTDKNGRTLNGAKYTLPQVKALTTLNGSEGWLKMTLLPQIVADTDPGAGTSTKLPDGTKGTDYGTKDVKSYLSGGTGNFADYTFSAAGLPAGLTMDANGVITGKPLETTTPGGVSVTVYLRGKDGTVAERSSTSVTFQLHINTDLKAAKDTLSATAQGGTTYTSSKPLRDVSSAAGISDGVSPYSYKLQYKDGNGSWQNATTSGGRYQVPNADGSASGLLLDSNGKLVGATMGTVGFPELRVVVTDSDTVSCPQGCSLNVGLNLKRVDDRRPSVAEDASITANVGETVTGFLPVNDPSGTPTNYIITSQVKLDGVTLTVDSDTGKYTLKATNQAQAGNSGSVTLKVTGANGMVGTVTLRVHVVDQRVPQTNNNVEIDLEQGIPVPTTAKVTGAVDAAVSPAIKCFATSDFVPAATSPCPTAAQNLPGLTGVTLNPDGTLTGTPVKGDVGEHQVPLKALGVNGVWSAEFSVKITVSPSTLAFEPGVAPGGTTGQAYEWTFNPATGAEGLTKTYQVIGSGGNEVSGCRVDTSGSKPKLTCSDGALTNGETYTLRVSAGTGTAAVSIDRVFTPAIYPPLKFESYTLPSAAVGAVYQQEDGSTFRFAAAGGSGSYGFGFATGSGHTPATAPLSCTGWALYTTDNKDSGLCLERDGRVTGTPTKAGTIDLSKLEVTDSAQHKAGLPAGAKKTLVINPLLQLTTSCVKPTSGADRHDNYECKGVKKQPVGEGNKLKIATVSGGATPYSDPRVEGLDAYNAGAGSSTAKLSAGWCGNPPTSNAGGDICLTGTWPKTMVPGSSLNIYVTGAAGRTVTVEAFIPVATDLKFTDEPQDANGTPVVIPSGVSIAQTGNGAKPGNIDQTTWDKVSSKIVSNLPIIGISLGEQAVKDGQSLKIPSLVTGGVSPYTYLTVPCDNTDASGNCALGDTGLFLNKSTGQLVGIPKPGASAAVVVSVTDSDSPAQTKKSNLVFSIADTRKPKVTATTINAEVDTAVSQVIPVSDGSGQYASVTPADKPDWMTLTLANNVLTVTGTPAPGDVTSTTTTFSVTVSDANGNVSDPATITYTVVDNRVPALSSLANGNLTGTEGKSVQGWTDLPKDATGYGPKITSWTVEGLPQGVTFDPDTGTLSPNKIASGESGTYPITITATAENGKTTTIVKNLVVTASDLAVTEANAGNLSQDRILSNDPAIIATVSGGTGTYPLVSVDGLPNTLTATLNSSGNIELSGEIPDEDKDYSVTITVKDSDGVLRTLTRTLHIGKGLSVAKTTMPTATIDENYGSQCLGVSGGKPGYSVDGDPSGLPDGMLLAANNDGSDICLTGTPSGNAGAVQVTFTLKDSATSPQATKVVTLTIPVNDEFTATEPNPSSHNFYAGSAINPFIPTEGSGDTCYGPNASGGCLKADITYSASGLPAGLSINPETGLISGTPTELVSNRTVTVTVASSAPGSNPITQQFQITVASAFSNPANHFNVPPGVTTPELDTNGTVKTDNPSNQVLPVPEIKNASNETIATGKYSIQGVTPDSQGNYPLDYTGLALTPDGKLVGTLKLGQPPTAGTNGTFNLGDYPIMLQDNADGEPTNTTSNVTFSVTDTREPTITVTSATVEVGQAADISIGVTGGSGKIDTVSLSGCNNLSVSEGKIHVPKNAFSEGTKVTCQVTVKDHNGKSVNSTLTISVNDSRQPKFNTNERERYAWQGLDFTNVTLDSTNPSVKGIPVMTWLVDPSKDSTAAPLKSVKIAGLPKQFKVVSSGGNATLNTDGSYTCSNPADCTIVDYATQEFSGVKDFTLTIKANTQNSKEQPTNLTASKSIPLRVFASPLQLNTTTPNGMIRATNGNYASTVGTVDYRGTITSTTQAGTALINNASAWNGTYALGDANYTIVEVTAYKRDGSSENVGVDKLTLTAADSGDAAMPKGDQTKKAQTLTLSSADTGAIPEGTTSLAVELKVTDGHGMVRSATVNIPVVQKLEWAGPPFNSQGDPVTLDTVGVPGAPYPAYYAEAKGGDGSLSTSLADANTVINNAVDADAKAKFNGGASYTGYKGIEPVYCEAQGESRSDTRPKCFPIPGLEGTIPTNTWDNPVPANYKGLFMLSNGKLSGSIPDNVTADTYSAQVLVIDGSGQLITKKFSIKVEKKLTLTLTLPNNKLPDGKKGICYGSTTGEKPNNGTCSAKVDVGTYDGPAGTTTTCELIPPVKGLAVTCTGGTVTISGAPTQTYDGNATVKVTLTGGAGQSVEKTVPLLIETDMIFKGNSDPNTGTGVKVETDSTTGEQKIEVNTTADGKDFPDMKLDITGGVPPYTYYVEGKDGNRVSPVPCPAGVESTTSKPIVCYPIGTTGLVLDSEGNVHGTPIPGGNAEGNFVVADSDTTSRTKKAAITVNITDQRPPQVYNLTINTTVGATSLSGSTQLVAEDPQNPEVDTSAEAKAKWPSNQQTAASKHGFSTIKPTGALGTPDECSVTDSMPGWLTLGTDGVISLASNQKVPVNAAGEPHKFCVWYVGPNGVNASKPAVVSVNVTDQRRVTIDSGNGAITEAKIGEKLADSATPKPLIEVKIPADLFNYGANHDSATVTKLNPDGSACTEPSCKFTPTGTGFTDESIDGLKVTGLNCDNSDPRSCSVKVSGTPKPSAAGDHQLSYQLTLPNGQTQIISHTIHIPPYDLALSVEPMNPAVVGLQYVDTSKPVMAVGGSGKYWFQLWDPDNKPAKVGDMSLVTTGNQVKLKWKPTADDLAKASGGNIPVTITVWDKTHCGITTNPGAGQPGPASCLYKVTKTVNIPLHAAPDTKDIKVPEVTEGTSASSSPVYTGSDNPELALFSTVPPGNEDLFTFDPNSGVVTLKDTARPGTYTAVIRVTLPGVITPFYRNVTFTVKEKPVPEPTNPAPIPTTTPEPRPGVAPLSPSTGITYPVSDLDTLVVRHGGNDRIDTSLAVLDFFSAKS